MGISGNRPFTNLCKQFRYGAVMAGLDTQSQSIGEKANQTFQFTACTVGNGSTDDNIILTTEAGKDNGPSCEQGHKQGSVLALIKRLKGCEYFSIQMDRYLTARIALYRWTWSIRRQFQQSWCSLELVTPKITLFGQVFSLQLAALPDRIIGILNRQRW
ncbi:hypothetical protein Xmir_04393 [Xenorhabdus miraniensis]|uniref:Uncharacterized protein n=1 Tax=Xenorhabdus miraniensis TaxID=351674 RepID=A0A2D0J774_9GAMM|nr:hypothetical protein Xmir_04393 [Xenorhabdus miraniensis]